MGVDVVEKERLLKLQEERSSTADESIKLVPMDIVGEFLEKQEIAQRKARAAEKAERKAKRSDGQSGRPYCFSLISYIEISALDKYLRSAHWINHFSYVTHTEDLWNEQDEKENKNHVAGTLKDPHTHILIYTYDGKSVSAVKKNFDRMSREYYSTRDSPAQNTLCQACYDALTIYRYQLHLDEVDKVRYDPLLRVVDDANYWAKFEKTEGSTSADNKCLTIVNMILAGVPYYKLVELFGKDFVYHYRNYRDVCDSIIEQNRMRSGDGRVLQFFYEKCLLNSDFSDEQKQTFFKMFAYIQTQFLYEYADKEYYEKNI